MRLSRPAALAACLLLASPAAFAVTSLKLLRTADGSVRTYTAPTASFVASGNAESLTLRVTTATEWHYLTIAAPRGQTLTRGSYSSAERASFRTGRSPGLDISGNGSGCNEVWGNFTIRQIGFGPSGELNLLDATLNQNCESATAPRLTATVLFNAEPWSFNYASTAGDYLGGGLKKSFTGNTSDFFLTGTPSFINYAATGNREDWSVRLSPPTGQALAVGTYPTQRFASAGVAGLDVSGNGRGCNTSSGTVTIKDIQVNASNQVTGLWAFFTQYCGNSTAPYKGTIRYFR